MEREKIERAVFFHGSIPENRRLIKGKVLCLGSEFCPALLVRKKDIEAALNTALSGIAVYTSFLNERELGEHISALEEILKDFGDIEVMINDFGLLSWLVKKFPGVKKGIARPLSVEFMRMPYRQLSDFMSKWSLSSIETDECSMISNFPQKRNFNVYFRLGPVFSAMSRFCPFTRKISPGCSFQCKGRLDKFSVKGSRQKIYRYEKGYFSACEEIDLKLKPQRIVEDIFQAP